LFVFIYSSIFISDPSKGYKGITAFIVEKEWGVQIAKREKKVCYNKKKKKKSDENTLLTSWCVFFL
jgi:hypothetical protein